MEDLAIHMGLFGDIYGIGGDSAVGEMMGLAFGDDDAYMNRHKNLFKDDENELTGTNVPVDVPNASATGAEGPPGSDRRSAMRICRFFEQGNCRFGDKCRFSHQLGATTTAQKSARGDDGGDRSTKRKRQEQSKKGSVKGPLRRPEPAGGPPHLHPGVKGEYSMTRGSEALAATSKVSTVPAKGTPVDPSVRAFVCIRGQRPRLSSQDIQLITKTYPNLAHVDIIGTGTGSSGLVQLATACPFIEVLDIKECGCDAATFQQLVRLLPRLKYIDLRDTPVGGQLGGNETSKAYPNLLVDL